MTSHYLQGEKTPETIQLRTKIQTGCEQQIFEFFDAGGQVVIYDANNGTAKARNRVAEKFSQEDIHIIFLGSTYFSFS
jgi:6-phosphofructo-2-kinase/fructose-2,6-biphosphatase 4